MTKKQNLLKNRAKSFVWRLLMMIVAATVAFLSENLNLFDLSPQATVVLGLFLGEVTKYLNAKGVL